MGGNGEVVMGFPCPTRFEGGTAAKFAQTITIQPYSQIGNLRVIVPTPGTPVQVSTSHIACDLIVVSGLTGNANLCAVGSQNVRAAAASQAGMVVISANPPLFIYLDDLFKLWVDAIGANDGIAVAYFRY